MQNATVFLYALIPAIALMATGIIAMYRHPSQRLNSIVQHFAAGLVFAAVAVELLPDEKGENPLLVFVGFAVGTLAMLGMEMAIRRYEKRQAVKSEGNLGMLIASAIDFLIDGILIGLAFTLGGKAGLLVTIALGAEFGSLGFTLSVELKELGLNPKQHYLYLGALAAMPIVGAAIGMLVLAAAPHAVMTLSLAFAIAALLYLVTEELLIEAHSKGNEEFATAMFFVGFLMIFLIDMVSVG